MKQLIIILLCVAGYNLSAQTLEVNIANLKNQQGTLNVALYNSEDSYLKKPFKAQSVKLYKNQVKVIFENIPAGEYAVSLYHDENENKKMDSNFMGIPKEGYGFSNNPSSMFGPASYEKAKFDLAGAKAMEISLHYF